MVGNIIILLVLLMLYCCIIQGKQADKEIDKIYWEKRENDIRKG